MNPSIEELTAAIEREARKWPEALRLMTHPGVGPLTALAFVLIIGAPERFPCGKQIGSHVGLIPCGGLQCGPSTTRPHHQARQFPVAFLAGGSSASGSALRCGLAASVFAPGDAAAKEHRQGSYGPQTGSSVVLDVAERLGIYAMGQVRFARGTARNRKWRVVERRPSEWASRSFARGSLDE